MTAAEVQATISGDVERARWAALAATVPPCMPDGLPSGVRQQARFVRLASAACCAAEAAASAAAEASDLPGVGGGPECAALVAANAAEHAAEAATDAADAAEIIARHVRREVVDCIRRAAEAGRDVQATRAGLPALPPHPAYAANPAQ